MSLRRLSMALFVACRLSASTISTTWNGQTDGSWTNAANWSAGVASNTPANNFSAIFPDVSPAGTNNVSLASDVTISGLSLNTQTKVTIQNGKTLTLDSGTFTSQGSITGAVAISGAANATFTGGSGLLGTLTNSSTGTVTFQSTQAPSLVNPSGGVVNLNSVASVGSTIANDGSIVVTGGLSAFNNITLSGTGTLTLAGGISGGNGGLANSSTIVGFGTVSKGIANSGTITASGGQLILGSTNNSGTLQADSGGTLTLQNGFTNTGTIKANTGGAVTIKGGDNSASTGSFVADGGTLTLQNLHPLNRYFDSVVAQNSGTAVVNTTLSGPATVHSTGSLDLNGTLASLTVDSGGTVVVHGGVINSLSNSGSITSAVSFTTGSLTNNASGTMALSGGIFLQGNTFTNNGSIQMTGGSFSNQNLSTLSGAGTLTIAGTSLDGVSVVNGAAHTIEGSGTVSLHLTNDGKLIATGGDLTIGPSLPFTNNGLLSANTGSVLITPTQAGRFTNLASGVLTGGTYEAHGGNNIEFVGAATVTTNNASISLFNNGQILDYSDTSHGISNQLSINNGTLDLENTAYQATSSGDFQNFGHLIIGGGTVFTNGLQKAVTNTAGGTISGTGKITGLVKNLGVVAPGDDPGQLTVGSYFQSSTGELDIEFATLNSWSSLAVLGNAQLNGILHVFTDPGFDAPLGTEFQILSAATLTGAGFQNFQTTFFNGKQFRLEQTATGFDVQVAEAPEPATLPLMLLTMAGSAVVWSRRGAGREKRRCDTALM